MKALFIIGTDTGVGKSVVTGLLGRLLQEKGHRVITQKWAQTGSGSFSCDMKLHLKLMKRTRRDIQKYLPFISPYNFTFPSSPHLAASVENKKIDARRIKKSFKILSDNFDFVIVEGTGGALVPLSKTELIIDIAKELAIPVLIVAGNKTGAINHTLLTIEAVKRRGMKIAGLVFNNCYKGVNKMVLKDNPEIIRSLSGVPVLGTLPRVKDPVLLYKAFPLIGEKIFACLKGGSK
ncbi:MAG: dethiobiotin synthase [Candidatus Omnitrophota bacterium]|nr:dethiobiotin synthase [Candidatus Omnitrophota bacterium]